MAEGEEIPIAEERGAEVKQTVKSRLEQWRTRMLKDNKVSHEWAHAIDTIRSSLKEGSARQKIFDRVRPMLETAAAARGTQLEVQKKMNGAIGFICKAVAILSPEPGTKFIAGALGVKLAFEEKMMGLPDRIATKYVDMSTKIGQRISVTRSINERIDTVLDRILIRPKMTGARVPSI